VATLPAAPASCTFDEQALFTDGEFPCWQSTNRCLLLFTDGEFPRAGRVDTPGAGLEPGVGTGRRASRTYTPEVIIPCKDDEAIALSLLLADDDDWW